MGGAIGEGDLGGGSQGRVFVGKTGGERSSRGCEGHMGACCGCGSTLQLIDSANVSGCTLMPDTQQTAADVPNM